MNFPKLGASQLSPGQLPAAASPPLECARLPQRDKLGAKASAPQHLETCKERVQAQLLRRVALGPGPTQYLVWPFSLYCQGRNWALRSSNSGWKSAAAQLYQTPNFPEFPWLSDPTPSSQASAASPGSGSGAPVSEVAGAARAQEPPPGAERAQVAGVVPPSLPQPTLARPPRSSLRPSSPGSSIRPWCAAPGDLLGLNGHPLPSTGLRSSSASGPG